MTGSDSTLVLFTSNRRKKYARDAVEVASLPSGTNFRFRYNEKYVAKGTRSQWKADKLVGATGLILFSVQHPDQFHSAYFVPVRWMKVLRTWVEGSTYLVEFELAEFATLERSGGRGQHIRLFADQLLGSLEGESPDKGTSAIYAELSVEPDHGWDIADWEHVVQDLWHTGEYPTMRFYRALNLETDSGRLVPPSKDGAFPVRGGSTYTLSVLHHQPASIDGVEYLALTPGNSDLTKIVGTKRIEISSGYDSVDLLIRFAKVQESTETVLTIGPEDETVAVTARIRFIIEPNKTRKARDAALASVGGLMLAVPGLSNLGDGAWEWPVALTGAGLLGVYGYLGIDPVAID